MYACAFVCMHACARIERAYIYACRCMHMHADGCKQVQHVPYLLATQKHGFASHERGVGTDPLCNTKPWYRTYKSCMTRACVFVSLAWGDLPQSPVTQSRSSVSQTKLWTEHYYLLLDLDTCLAPEAKVRADRNYGF